jgi:hypothetical protein
MLDVSEYFRWTRSAYKTLESAERDMRDGDYNWSCFKALRKLSRLSYGVSGSLKLGILWFISCNTWLMSLG